MGCWCSGCWRDGFELNILSWKSKNLQMCLFVLSATLFPASSFGEKNLVVTLVNVFLVRAVQQLLLFNYHKQKMVLQPSLTASTLQPPNTQQRVGNAIIMFPNQKTKVRKMDRHVIAHSCFLLSNP